MLVAHLPATSDTRAAIDPDGAREAAWGLTDHLLALVVDRLAVVSWQLENQGRRTPTRRPRPLPRPGVSDGTTRMGTARPLSEVKAILAPSRPGADTGADSGSD